MAATLVAKGQGLTEVTIPSQSAVKLDINKAITVN
tara:strand:+ start:3801 stop:3905 length:105 start_codon:yes stop_codon:yes gene_type:complete